MAIIPLKVCDRCYRPKRELAPYCVAFVEQKNLPSLLKDDEPGAASTLFKTKLWCKVCAKRAKHFLARAVEPMPDRQEAEEVTT